MVLHVNNLVVINIGITMANFIGKMDLLVNMSVVANNGLSMENKYYENNRPHCQKVFW
jgi:hypothetical protein